MSKVLRAIGPSGQPHATPFDAARASYVTDRGDFPPTPLDMPENPLASEIPTAQYILDLGCGVGRNLPWIMERTGATYIGVDPNPSMLQFFWAVQDPQFLNRVQLYPDLESVPKDIVFDVVLSTFTLQHIGFRVGGDTMNVVDIIKSIKPLTNVFTVWIALEHEVDEPGWIAQWAEECGIMFVAFERNYQQYPDLTHRGVPHLMIWQDQ
jgi:SAM-dependent methyltransferase